MSKTIHKNIVYLRSRKIERRNAVEAYCKIADTLPPQQGILFCLYYRHGYLTTQIGVLLGIHDSNVGRRLKTVEKKIRQIIKRGTQ